MISFSRNIFPWISLELELGSAAGKFPLKGRVRLIHPLHGRDGGGIVVCADIVPLVVEQVGAGGKGDGLFNQVGFRPQIQAVGELGLHLFSPEVVRVKKRVNGRVAPDGHGPLLNKTHLGHKLPARIVQKVFNVLLGLLGKEQGEYSDKCDPQKQDGAGR